MTDHSEPYWCDEHNPPVKCYEWCPACAEWGEYEVSEDCKQCGSMMWLLDSEGLCPACNGLGFDEDGEPVYEEKE